jgi:hypothetical protein
MNRVQFGIREGIDFRGCLFAQFGYKETMCCRLSIDILTSVEARRGDRGLELSTRNWGDFSVHNIPEEPAKV